MENLIGKEFRDTIWGMTRTSAHGSIDQTFIIEEDLGDFLKCRKIWSESWGRKDKDYNYNSFQEFSKSDIINRLK